MDSNWAQEVLQLSRRTNEADAERFVELVRSARGSCNLEDCRTLLRTYFDDLEDYGTQETVTAVIFSAGEEVALLAILYELPSLMERAPTWAHALVNPVVLHHPDLALKIARGANPEQRTAMERLLNDLIARSANPNATRLVNELGMQRQCGHRVIRVRSNSEMISDLKKRLRAPVAEVVQLLVSGNFARLIEVAGGDIFSAEHASDLQMTIRNYGRTLVTPPEDAFDEMEIFKIDGGDSKRWFAAMPLWTVEEGRSDLEVRLVLTEKQGSIDIELRDILVP